MRRSKQLVKSTKSQAIRIITKENTENNEVFVNVSASGRLTSIGSALAAMANDAQAYYVEADSYSKTPKELEHGLSICNNLKIRFLSFFQFKLPKENGIKILVSYMKILMQKLLP